ncbi:MULTISPECIES: GNAT family N-acetyltransferase [unclassified Microbacterium]|uniref:GNAT family N-acetyltransferase n=1 Tax=unclassified Microbacterium TaxID=2609290 RepID=UPI00343DCC51
MSVQLIPLDENRFDTWLIATRERLIRLRQESRMLLGDDAVAHAEAFLTELLPSGWDTETSLILTIVDDGVEIGTVWLAANDGILFVVDLLFTTTPDETQRDGLFEALTALVTRQGVKRLSVALYATDADGHAFLQGRGFELASMQMLLEPLPVRDAAPRIELRRMTPERFVAFAAHSESAFADDLVASGRYSAEAAATESHRQMMLELPEGVDSAGQLLFTAHADDEEVGILWLGERTRVGRPHAFVLDIEVAEAHRRRGHGREIMLAAEQEARRIGAESIGLHVFGFNAGAIAMYEGLGYRRVEQRFLRSV